MGSMQQDHEAESSLIGRTESRFAPFSPFYSVRHHCLWNNATHVRLGLPSSVKSLWKFPHRLAQTYVIPDPVKLTVISHGLAKDYFAFWRKF